MFWNNKNKTDKRKKTQDLQSGSTEDVRGGRQGHAGDVLRAQALANARAARAHIGEETLDKIAAAMTRKQNSPVERAKLQIESADPERVVEELLNLLDED